MTFFLPLPAREPAARAGLPCGPRRRRARVPALRRPALPALHAAAFDHHVGRHPAGL